MGERNDSGTNDYIMFQSEIIRMSFCSTEASGDIITDPIIS